MPRRAITDEVQNRILTRSRRRCCLCFWLAGKDEVQKGQIAHLDQDNENPDEDNLCFLCLDHHDEYDGKTSVTKNLKQSEVRHWRDELYREMEYRFRTVKKHSCELSVVSAVFWCQKDTITFKFKFKNTGPSELKEASLSIKLIDKISGNKPRRAMSGGLLEMPDIFGMGETRADFFEPDGRIASISIPGGRSRILLSDTSMTFNGLSLRLRDLTPGSTVELPYRVDALETNPILGKVSLPIPKDASDLVEDD